MPREADVTLRPCARPAWSCWAASCRTPRPRGARRRSPAGRS